MISIACVLLLAAFSAVAQPLIPATPEAAPNPHFIRLKTLDLNGQWRVRDNGVHTDIRVPYVPQSRASGLEPHDVETLVYDRDISIPEGWRGGMLHFEGVDHFAEIYFDGVKVAEHAGGYAPFQVDVTEFIAGNRNTAHHLEVRVRDSNDQRSLIVGKQERTSNEGVIFYKNMTGIWKPVWLEEIEPTHIVNLRIETDMNGLFRVRGDIVNPNNEFLEAQITVIEPDGTPRYRSTTLASNGIDLETRLNKMRLWSPEEPNLYGLRIKLLTRDFRVFDEVISYTGFRTFEQRAGYFFLNGQPYQLRGVLDQGIYPHTLYTPQASDILRDIEYPKDAGFNGARIHQTTPTHRRLYEADRLGYWSSIELPSARNLTDDGDFNEALRQWKEILQAYAFGRPTVFYTVAGNEDWGWLEDHDHWAPTSPEKREEIQRRLFFETREAAPEKMLISAEDGWRSITGRKNGETVPDFPAEQLVIGLHDYRDSTGLYQTYLPIPVDAPAGTPIPHNGKPAFLDGYEYDGQAALMVSEAGGRAVTLNSNARIFAYGHLFQDIQSWAEETSNVIKTLGGIAIARGGYVLTQLRDAGNDPSDVNSGGELNGILTADGKEKTSAETLRAANEEAERRWLSHKDCEQLLTGTN